MGFQMFFETIECCSRGLATGVPQWVPREELTGV